jgi:hypothetical protein
MGSFSQRYGYEKCEIQLECATETLKNRIWGAFYKKEYDFYDTIEWKNYTTGIESMMIEMGISYHFPGNRIHKDKNAEALQRHLLETPNWYTIFNFIERYLAISDDDTVRVMKNTFNRILEEEVSGYRIIGKQVAPIINNEEIKTIQDAADTIHKSVNNHIVKALTLFADRQKPDYVNSVKESISAVEAMCCIITGMNGRDATLGNAIKKLKENGVIIHPFMEEAFCKLYGYTSNADGIRHGGIDYTQVPAEDAKYMLISCSAFVNYLKEKWSKIQK